MNPYFRKEVGIFVFFLAIFATSDAIAQLHSGAHRKREILQLRICKHESFKIRWNIRQKC